MENIIQPDFKASQAIIVYNQDLDHQGNNYYLESRRIKNGRMMEGKPLTKTLLSKIMSGINTEDIDNIYCEGLLPSKLLYQGKDKMDLKLIWYLKSSWQSLSFDKSLGIKDGIMKVPTLVFSLVGSNLSVFAVKTNSPNSKTILYQAPFHNIYESGSICMGSAKIVKSNEINEIMQNHENAFFQSKFTHLQSQGSPINGNLNTVLGACIRHKAKIPNDMLLKHKTKHLTDLI